MKEIHYHTLPQVRAAIAEAREIVVELELDDELRVPAFVKAIELLAAKHMIMDQTDAVGPVLPATLIPRH